MRWQYCPPASRTVICGGKYYLSAPHELSRSRGRATLDRLPRQAFLLRDALHQQLLGGSISATALGIASMACATSGSCSMPTRTDSSQLNAVMYISRFSCSFTHW